VCLSASGWLDSHSELLVTDARNPACLVGDFSYGSQVNKASVLLPLWWTGKQAKSRDLKKKKTPQKNLFLIVLLGGDYMARKTLMEIFSI